MFYSFQEVLTTLWQYLEDMRGVVSVKGIFSLVLALLTNLFLIEERVLIAWVIFNFLEWLASVTWNVVKQQKQFRRVTYSWFLKFLTHAILILILGYVFHLFNFISNSNLILINWIIFILILTDVAYILNTSIVLGAPIPSWAVKIVESLKSKIETNIDSNIDTKLEKVTQSEYDEHNPS